jgi:hypothetical protein
MSTAAVSSTSIFQELQSFNQNRQTDLQQLGSALKSGDLSGAQQAYTALATLGESGPFANSEPFAKSSRADAFNALGEALQAGDLARAESAFATLTGNQSASTAATTAAAVVNLTGTQSGAAAAASTSSSTSSIYQQIQSYRQQKQADLAQLGQDLTAGNASAAQQDFNTLTALGQSGPNANGQVFQNSARAQDFQALGQALQAGDLAGAQSDFANLSSTLNTVQTPPATGPEPAVPPATTPATSAGGIDEIIINLNLGSPSSTGSSSSSGSTAPGSTAGGSTPEIVINLGENGGPSTAPEEITINLGTASSASSSTSTTSSSSSSSASTTGASAPEIVLNLGQTSGSSSSSPEEITINLGGDSSGAQITIDHNQGQNGSSGSQQIINLNPQGNYELILNLLSSNPASQSASSSSNGLSVQA